MGKVWAFIKKMFGYDITKFVVVGGLGLVTDQAVYSFLRYFFDISLERDAILVRILPLFGYALAVLQNYMLNHYWTFRSRVEGTGASLRGLMLFFIVSLTALVPRLIVYYLVLGLFPDKYPYALDISNLIGIVAGTLFNYFGTKYFVFKPKEEK